MTPSRASGTIPVRLDVGFPENRKKKYKLVHEHLISSILRSSKNKKNLPHKHISNDILCFSDSYHIHPPQNLLRTYCTLTNMLGINRKCWLNSSQSVSFVSISMTLMLVSFLLCFLFYVSPNLIIILYQSIIVYFYLLDIHVTWKNL